jgi:hypothetical protein
MQPNDVVTELYLIGSLGARIEIKLALARSEAKDVKYDSTNLITNFRSLAVRDLMPGALLNLDIATLIGWPRNLSRVLEEM